MTAGLEPARQRRRQSIAIVATVFGPPPVWLPAFFLSCQRNADVSWIIVSSRRNKIAGPLTFSRNHELANSTYTLVPGVRRLSSDPAYCQLDERALTARPAERLEHEPPGGPRVYWNWKRHLTWSVEYQRDKAGDGRLLWREGRTFNVEGEELMYLHFHRLKKRLRRIDFDFLNAPAAFAVGRTEIVATSCVAYQP